MDLMQKTNQGVSLYAHVGANACVYTCAYIVQGKQVYSQKINPALSFPASIYEVNQALFQFTSLSIDHLFHLLDPWGDPESTTSCAPHA